MKTKPQRDTHIYFDDELFVQIERLAKKEDRSFTATARMLIKEALATRKKERP